MSQEKKYLDEWLHAEADRLEHGKDRQRLTVLNAFSLLLGFVGGIFVQVGGGILAGALHFTPWLVLWWGVGVTVYTIVKDYWLKGGKGFGRQPHWVQALLLTIPWGIVLHTGINYGVYRLLVWVLPA